MARIEELIDLYVDQIHKEIGTAHPETLKDESFSIKTVWDTVAREGYIERNDLNDTVARLAFVNFQKAVELAFIHAALENDPSVIIEGSAYPHHTKRAPTPLINKRGEISFETVREQFQHNNLLQHTVLGRTETVRDLMTLGVKVIAAFPHQSQAQRDLKEPQTQTFAAEQNNQTYGNNLITVDLKTFTAEDSGATFKFMTKDDGRRVFKVNAQQADTDGSGMRWAMTYGNPDTNKTVSKKLEETKNYLEKNMQGPERSAAITALGL